MRIIRAPSFLLLLLAATACDETIVYRDRELFEPVTAAAANFVGYTDRSQNLVVCGNCHIDQQQDWTGTAHAHAWQTLMNVPWRTGRQCVKAVMP